MQWHKLKGVTESTVQTLQNADSHLQSYLMVLAAMDWAISLDASSSSTARVAQPTTGGGRELEKRYGRDRCLRSSIKGLGPTV